MSKFLLGDVIFNLNSGFRFVVCGTPDRYRLEGNGAPAYAYTTFSLQDGSEPIWIRSAVEVEASFIKNPNSIEYGPQDWPQHAGYENGAYMNKCCHCGCTFTGHKLTPACRPCYEQRQFTLFG